MGSSASCFNGNKLREASKSPQAKKYQSITTDIQQVNIKALRDIGNSGSTIVSGHSYDQDGSNCGSNGHKCFQPVDYASSSCRNTLLEDELLPKAEFLSRNAWDRQVFIRYVLGDFWRGRVSPQLRRELAASAQWLKGNSNNIDALNGSSTISTSFSPNKRSPQYKSEIDEVSSHLNFTSEDLQQIMSMSQCQAFLIASVISSFFIFRREVDFNVVLEENAPALPSSIKGLTVDDDVHILQDHLYEENGEFFLDPEQILSMIAVSSAPEDLDKLLMNSNWLQHFSAGLENLQVSLKVIELPKFSKGNSEDASDSHSLQSYASDPVLAFENSYHHSFTSSLSPDSLSKIQTKNAISEMKATKGYVVLDHQDERLPITHFYASLPIPYVIPSKTSLIASNDNLYDDETTVTQSTVTRDCQYVITAYHKFSGMQYEKNTLRVIDFFLLTIGAVLFQSV